MKASPIISTTSTEAIQRHYDVANEFYAFWLDSRMVYSSGLWTHDRQSLDDAQLTKLRFHADAVGATGGCRILDVGCGWGALLELLVDEYGAAAAVGLTLSAEQASYVRSRCNASSPIAVHLTNWQEFLDNSKYDGIISVGAFEHFGRRDQSPEVRRATYADFFDFCRRRLPQGGHLSLQSIAYGRLRSLPQFIKDKIWPESELPTATEIIEAASRWFEIKLVVNHRTDYARTCGEWSARLSQKRTEAIRVVGEEKVDEYIRYLGMSTAAFHAGGLQLLRCVFRKISK